MGFDEQSTTRIAQTVVGWEQQKRGEPIRRARWFGSEEGGDTSIHVELSEYLLTGSLSPAWPRARPTPGASYVTDFTADQIAVVDVLGRFRGRARDDSAAAEFDNGGDRGRHGSFGRAVLRGGVWELDALQRNALLLWAVVNAPGSPGQGDEGGFTASDATIQVDNVTIVQPVDAAIIIEDIREVRNVHGWSGDDDQRIEAFWNAAWGNGTGRWEALQKDC